MKVYVLANGMNKDSKKNDLISTDDPDEIFDFPSWTTLICHEEGNILFDAACHVLPERQLPFIIENLHMTDEDTPMNRMREVGVEPEDINYILLSHMHPDHFGYIDQFPNAEIIVSDDEFTYMIKDYALKRFPFTKDFDHFLQQDLNWSLFPSDVEFKELMKGVTIVNFGRGHSYGMLGLLLDLDCGKKLLISDVIYSSENVGPPVREPGICRDKENWYRAMDYALKLAEEQNAEIWYGHDLAQFENLTKATEGYYE